MRKKKYILLRELIEINTEEINDYFIDYEASVHRRLSRETLAGYKLHQCACEFVQMTTEQSTILLEKIEAYIVASGRSLSSKQRKQLLEICKRTFALIISRYANMISKEVSANESVTLMLYNQEQRVCSKLDIGLDIISMKTRWTIDKSLVWTAVGVGVAAASLLVDVIISVISFYRGS